jgi:hypothetical protein
MLLVLLLMIMEATQMAIEAVSNNNQNMNQLNEINP